MPFIILGDHVQEWERRPLRKAITIGRSSDCELPIRDTLLSRRHCRLEPHGNRWVLIDLQSRNGTRIGENPVTREVLEDGDVVRIGQTQVCFRAGAFVPPKPPTQIPPRARPLDPHEALAATLSGVDFAAPDPERVVPHFPIPQPKPAEPKSFQRDGVELLVSKMASGVWDSRVANQALTRRPIPMTPWENENPPSVRETDAKEKSRVTESAALGAHKPRRWLVMVYLLLAGGVFAVSLCAIIWPGV